MTFYAIIFDDTKEKAIKLGHLPKLGIDSDKYGCQYTAFWLPKKAISEIATSDHYKTQKGKKYVQIHICGWADQLVQDSYEKSLETRKAKTLEQIFFEENAEIYNPKNKQHRKLFRRIRRRMKFDSKI